MPFKKYGDAEPLTEKPIEPPKPEPDSKPVEPAKDDKHE
jgi:hypothetical protein